MTPCSPRTRGARSARCRRSSSELVRFDRELSIIGARGRDGSVAFYPLVENHHREGILRLSVAPAPDLAPGLQAQAESRARAVMDRLEYVGVMAIELFQVGDRLLGNEMAPRVHNSGHWTIEGAETSQFENHLRAVTGMPLGSTVSRGSCAMVNLIGTVPDVAAVAGGAGRPPPSLRQGAATRPEARPRDRRGQRARIDRSGAPRGDSDPRFPESRYPVRPPG